MDGTALQSEPRLKSLGAEPDVAGPGTGQPVAGSSQSSDPFAPRAERARKLPRLVAQSLALVWSAGRRELLVTTVLQLLQGVGIAAQLLIAKRVLEAVVASGRSGGDFGVVVPDLAVLVAITVALTFAGAVQAEQSRILGELVARTAAVAAPAAPAGVSN